MVPWLYGLGFLVLAAGILYLWQYPSMPADTAVATSEIQAAGQKLDSVDARLTLLEQQPKPPPPPDLSKITTELGALEARVSDQTQLASRLDVMSGRIESLSGLSQTGIDAIKQQLETNAGRLTALEKTVGSLATVSSRVDRIVRVQAAALALADGQPLGDLPGAPPALSRYARTSPPTLAHLRLTFGQMEQTALAAGEANSINGPFIDRVWERAQGLVTVRQGDAVVVGNKSAIVLSHAKTALDAGDLAAAVKETARLDPNPAHVAADWLAEAKALLDARAALSDMAVHI
jgi:hypothetical protein